MNNATYGMIENALENADVYTDAMTFIDDNGEFTPESAKKFLKTHLYVYVTIKNVDWQQVADAINASHDYISLPG